jgi:hypothetical protein
MSGDVQKQRHPEYAGQCLDTTCGRDHYEWINYDRQAEGWECDTQGFATVTRLHQPEYDKLITNRMMANEIYRSRYRVE